MQTRVYLTKRQVFSIALGVLMAALVIAVGHVAAAVGDTKANICIQDNYTQHGNTQTLTCTANDVQLAEAIPSTICVLIDPTQPPSATNCRTNTSGQASCVPNSQFSFVADFKVVLTAQDRYDIGIYFATDGGGTDGALTGSCQLNIITAANNTTNFLNSDLASQPGDICGDIAGKINTQYNPQIVNLKVEDVDCVGVGDPPKLKLPYCTSWRQTGANDLCDEASDAFPGSPSKCSCNPGFTVDIFIEDASATVEKVATKAVVTYQVTVHNPTETRDLSLKAICDDKVGTIAAATGFSCTPSGPATGYALKSTTCGKGATDTPAGPGTLPFSMPHGGGDYVCTFDAQVPSSASQQTDTVTAKLRSVPENEAVEPTDTATVVITLNP